MLKTLHWYISRELLKVTLLALVAFTFVMTIFAIMEPLRKEGLGSDQVIALFAYTLPVMFSLTLPVAALFAATIVYGRFSQDRELMACRASGLSTLRVLQPALVLGGLVTIASLILSNFVAPQLASRGEQVVRANVQKIVYHQLKTKNSFKTDRYLVHADDVSEDGDKLNVYGCVIADTRKPGTVNIVVASLATIRIYDRDDETYACVQLIEPTAIQSGSGFVGQGRRQSIWWLRVPRFAKARPSFYDWGKLQAILKDPSQHPDVRRSLKKIMRRIGHRLLAKDVAETISAGKSYDKLMRATNLDGGSPSRCEISAGKVKIDLKGAAILSAGVDGQGNPLDVIVREKRDGVIWREYRPETAKIEAGIPPGSESSVVSIKLEGETSVRLDGDDTERVMRLGRPLGPLTMPAEISEKVATIKMDALYERPEEIREIIDDKIIWGELEYLKNEQVGRILRKIVAEMHGRIAYGVSCFLLVAMGAALGIIFRGGQVISAFVLSLAPALLVIIMVLMGKQLVVNKSVSTATGLLGIWSGDIMLLGATVWVYARQIRK